MPAPQLTPHAKAVIAGLAAVIIAGITAGQQIRGGSFHLADALPVAVAVLGAAQTHLIPNVPQLPWAKAVIAGASAVLTAAATLVAQDPSGVTAAKLLTVTAGAFLVWFVPELAPAVKVVEGEVASGAPLSQLAVTVAGDVSALMGPDLPAPVVPTPRQADTVPSSAYLVHDLPKTAAVEPTPIADAARDAALTTTAPMPAVTA